jgi:hypothetical protein
VRFLCEWTQIIGRPKAGQNARMMEERLDASGTGDPVHSR